MFTGIIEELGTLSAFDENTGGARITVSSRMVISDIREGDSVSVNGVCLTAVGITENSFSADVSLETLDRTTLGRLKEGSMVNLERAMLPTTRFGGHIVQGHIDGRGTLAGASKDGDFWTVTFGFPPELAPYLVKKGSVAVEGISLTIARLAETSFDAALIPKTWAMTNLSTIQPGEAVNMEADVIAKYIERIMLVRS